LQVDAVVLHSVAASAGFDIDEKVDGVRLMIVAARNRAEHLDVARPMTLRRIQDFAAVPRSDSSAMVLMIAARDCRPTTTRS
jgi:hypothetical protein